VLRTADLGGRRWADLNTNSAALDSGGGEFVLGMFRTSPNGRG
jgi:hypothetical protein